MDPLYSPSWYRVAELRPRLSRHAEFHRHVYRGRVWYLVQNPTDLRVHRLTPVAHALVSSMDGTRATHEVWEEAVARLGDAAPTQDETLRVLSLLYSADVLRCDIPPDTEELFRQLREREEKETRSKRNPLSFKVPLLDPDAFLGRFEPWLRPLFSRGGAVVWAAVVLLGAFAAVANAPELAAGARGLLEPAGLAALWFAYPLVKIVHELGHGFAVKRWGGEVHEMGVLFLVFVPVPYVEASAATVFPEKRRRVIVSGAGVAVELFLAAVGCLVWLAVEPGWLRHGAWAVMVLGGVSTALFNGNPLLKFDGYYAFADALEIPNLDGRSKQYVGALWRRYALGLHTQSLPETAPGEARWLVAYATTAAVYRLGVTLAIAMFLASRFFLVGVALAALCVVMRVVVPVLKQLWSLASDPSLGDRRGRALAGSLGPVALIAIALFALPLPLRSRGEGVVWLPDQANVRAGAAGFVVEVLAEPHSLVEVGWPLIRTVDPGTDAALHQLEADGRALQLRVNDASDRDRVEADILREQLASVGAELARARERAGQVVIVAPTRGVFIPLQGTDLLDRYVRQGEVVGHVVDLSKATARVVVQEQDMALLRERTRASWVRLAHDVGTVLPARITHDVPAATNRLPTAALGTAGGGPFAVDPSDSEGVRTMQAVYQLDLELPANARVPAAGERVYARFDHGAEPMAFRAYRSLRRVFLRQLGV